MNRTPAKRPRSSSPLQQPLSTSRTSKSPRSALDLPSHQEPVRSSAVAYEDDHDLPYPRLSDAERDDADDWEKDSATGPYEEEALQESPDEMVDMEGEMFFLGDVTDDAEGFGSELGDNGGGVCSSSFLPRGCS